MQTTKTYLSTLLHLLAEHPRTQGLGEALADAKKYSIEIDKNLIDRLLDMISGEIKSDKKADLFSIFENIKQENKTYNYKLPNKAIDLSEAHFPNKANQDEKQWLEGFKTDLKKIEFSEATLKANTETLLFVLQKWTSNLASGYGSNIPFIDVAKLLSAAMVCLQSADNQEDKFLMIGGGVSGVQDYLYDIVSKNASKNLKGRSFYIHALSDAVLYKILYKLGLYQCNIVFASGGGFYILAPNNQETIASLEALKTEISRALFETHRVALYMELVWEEVSENRLKNDFSKVCKSIATKIGEEKKHKFNQQIKENFADLFEPSGEGGETKRDAVTGEELIYKIKDDDKTYILGDAIPKQADKEEFKKGNDLINAKTFSQIKLGYGLKSSEAYYIANQKVIDRKNHDFLIQLGVNVGFEKGENEENEYRFLINKFDFIKNNTEAQGFQLYGGNDYPTIRIKGKQDRATTFSELCGMKEVEDGEAVEYFDIFHEPTFKRLGVLRMDVDGLGNVFKTDVHSLAAYSTLSRNLDWFFKGYLNTIWKEKYAANTQIIYSGGDDLFIVGRWNEIIDFAKDIKNKFEEYVCHNKNLGISAGISIVTPKFPIMKAAKEYAGAAEHQAKNHIYKEIEKKSIAVFGEVFNWNDEFVKLEALKNQFAKFVESGIFPKAMLYKLDGFYYKAFPPKEGEKEDLAWHWQLAYDISRLKERNKNRLTEDAKQFLEDLVKWSISNESNLTDGAKFGGKSFFKFIRVAAIWASFEIRNKDK